VWTCLFDAFRLCEATIQSTPDKILRWGIKREVVFQSASPRVSRDFVMVAYCLRLTQSVLTMGNTGDRTGKSLPVCFRRGKKRIEATGPKSNSRQSKTPNGAQGTVPKHHYLF